MRIVLLLLALSLSGGALAQDVIMRTTEGDITLRLYPQQAPITVANFLSYVDSGFYSGTIFHRVIPRFMIQGGGFTSELDKKPTLDPIVNESQNRLHNEKGTIAMARTNDPDSATAQFFINLKMNPTLDYRAGREGYAVFGEVIEGMDVVGAITLIPTMSMGGMQNVPQQPVTILEVVRKAQP